MQSLLLNINDFTVTYLDTPFQKSILLNQIIVVFNQYDTLNIKPAPLLLPGDAEKKIPRGASTYDLIRVPGPLRADLWTPPSPPAPTPLTLFSIVAYIL